MMYLKFAKVGYNNLEVLDSIKTLFYCLTIFGGEVQFLNLSNNKVIKMQIYLYIYNLSTKIIVQL